VDHAEVLWLTAFAVTVPVIASAALSDWRTREVSDRHWAAIGGVGTILFLIYSIMEEGLKWEFLCLAAGSALILADVLWERDSGPKALYPIMAAVFAVPLYFLHGDGLFSAWLSVPVCYLMYLAMYYTGILKGGADAKCLIVLSMMFPVFPQAFGLPLIEVNGVAAAIFVPSLSILFFSSVAVIPIAAAMAAVNAIRGDFDRRMFTGRRMDIDAAASAHVWPIEDAVNGEIVRIKPNDRSGEVFERLRDAGAEKVWVTPMLPFIVPMAAVALIVLTIGNPLFLTL
jgi:preflagellin peptidase FlaK